MSIWAISRPARVLIRSSMVYMPWAKGASRGSSLRSSSAIKPTLPARAVDLKTLVEQSHNIWKEEGP